MAEPGVINTVVVRNGESFQVSIRRANGASASTKIQHTNPITQTVPTSRTSTVLDTEPDTNTTATTNAATVQPSSSVFVLPIVNFMNNIQKTYNEPNMTNDAIDKHISQLSINSIPKSFDKAREIYTKLGDNLLGNTYEKLAYNLIGDTVLNRTAKSGYKTFETYIKTIIANERERAINAAIEATRPHSSLMTGHAQAQKNSEEAKAELDAAEKQYNDAKSAVTMSADAAAKAKKIHDDAAAAAADAYTAADAAAQQVRSAETGILVKSDIYSKALAGHVVAAAQLVDAQDKANKADAEKKITETAALAATVFAAQADARLAAATKEFNKARITANTFTTATTVPEDAAKKVVQDAANGVSNTNETVTKIAKDAIVEYIKQILQKAITLIEMRLKNIKTDEIQVIANNDTEENKREKENNNKKKETDDIENILKAIQNGLSDYLVNRTIDETDRYVISGLNNTNGKFIPISDKIKNDNNNLPKSIIDRMIDAARMVFLSKTDDVNPSTITNIKSMTDTDAKNAIKKEFYNMNPPKWEKSGLRGGRRTLRRKMVRRKTRRITRPY